MTSGDSRSACRAIGSRASPHPEGASLGAVRQLAAPVQAPLFDSLGADRLEPSDRAGKLGGPLTALAPSLTPPLRGEVEAAMGRLGGVQCRALSSLSIGTPTI